MPRAPNTREAGYEVRRRARARAQPSPSASTVRYNITGKPPDKPSILIVPSMSYVAVRGKGDPNAEGGA